VWWVSTLVVGLVGLAGIVGTFYAPARVARLMEERRERREFRRAKRLVLEELETIKVHLELLQLNLSTPRYEAATGAPYLPTVQWEGQKSFLAESLDDEVWGLLPTVLHGVDRHRNIILRDPPQTPLTAQALASIAEEIELVEAAHEALRDAKPISD